jgi:hypothetical protein
MSPAAVRRTRAEGEPTILEMTALLLDAQDSDGGWGFVPGQAGNTECTALACWALSAQGSVAPQSLSAIEAGLAWLRSRQRADGGWPTSDQVSAASWMSGVAVLALSHFEGQTGAASAGAQWLLRRESRTPPLLVKLLRRFRSEPPAVDQDSSLIGWPWTDDTTAWVEPTSYALLALKRLRSVLPRDRTAERINLAERMLFDRMCVGGGWNYGNKLVMGSEVAPYPDTTALALIALQDAPPSDAITTSLARLREMIEVNRSGLVLSLATLCLDLYGQDVAPLRAELVRRYAAGRFRRETRVLALTLLALDDGTPTFRVGDAHD